MQLVVQENQVQVLLYAVKQLSLVLQLVVVKQVVMVVLGAVLVMACACSIKRDNISCAVCSTAGGAVPGAGIAEL